MGACAWGLDPDSYVLEPVGQHRDDGNVVPCRGLPPRLRVRGSCRGVGGATYFFVLKAVAEDECGRIAGDVTWLLMVV